MRNTASGKHTLPQYSATHFSTESISHYTQYAQPHHVADAAQWWLRQSLRGCALRVRPIVGPHGVPNWPRGANSDPCATDRYAGRTPTQETTQPKTGAVPRTGPVPPSVGRAPR